MPCKLFRINTYRSRLFTSQKSGWGCSVLLRPLKPRRRTERLRREKPLTIAAGFRLDESLFLCADSMWNDGFTKHHAPKIFDAPIGLSAEGLFAVAGSGDHAKALSQQLVALVHGQSLSIAEIKAIFETKVADYYNLHSSSIGDSGVQLLHSNRASNRWHDPTCL
jgi:hypothetical protein